MITEQARRFRVHAGRCAARKFAPDGYPNMRKANANSLRNRAIRKAQRLLLWLDAFGWKCECGRRPGSQLPQVPETYKQRKQRLEREAEQAAETDAAANNVLQDRVANAYHLSQARTKPYI